MPVKEPLSDKDWAVLTRAVDDLDQTLTRVFADKYDAEQKIKELETLWGQIRKARQGLKVALLNSNITYETVLEELRAMAQALKKMGKI